MISIDMVIGLDMFDVVRRAKEKVKTGWQILGDLYYASDVNKPTIWFVFIAGTA